MIKSWQEMDDVRHDWDVPIFCNKHDQEGKRMILAGGLDAIKPNQDIQMDYVQPQKQVELPEASLYEEQSSPETDTDENDEQSWNGNIAKNEPLNI